MLRRSVLLALVAITTTVVGCSSPPPREDPISCTYYSSGFQVYRHDTDYYLTPRTAAAAPPLELSKEEIAQALAKQAERAPVSAHRVADSSHLDLGETATAIEACFHDGDRDGGLAIAANHSGVAVWQNAAKLVTVSCHYDGEALSVELTRRPEISGPLAIVFAPGTYGAPRPLADVARGDGWTKPEDDQRYGHWPSAQDLALLRAPVVELGADQESVTAAFPIACASFSKGPPSQGQEYQLCAFEPGSPADKLLVALCALDRAPPAASQLALWLARNDISWDAFQQKRNNYGGLMTFGSHDIIREDQAGEAARLLLNSGLDPSRTHFFNGAGWEAPRTTGETPASATPPEPVGSP